MIWNFAVDTKSESGPVTAGWHHRGDERSQVRGDDNSTETGVSEDHREAAGEDVREYRRGCSTGTIVC